MWDRGPPPAPNCNKCETCHKNCNAGETNPLTCGRQSRNIAEKKSTTLNDKELVMQNTNEKSSTLASNTLAGRSFNVRVSFDSAGAPVIGFVHGMYEMSETITEIRRIPEAEHLSIAKALGIRSSSVHCSVNRALRRSTDVQPEDDPTSMEAVTC